MRVYFVVDREEGMSESMIEAFNRIRDIPYRIPLSTTEEDHCCSGKAKQLCKILEQEGHQVRYRVCEFKWSDMKLPESVATFPHEDLSSHVYLEVLIGDSWIIVDPTWDKKLSSIFNIAQWDGQHSTSVAVPATSVLDVNKSEAIMADDSPETIEHDLAINGLFYQAFNAWLETIRKESI